jgi:hypothetical protein
MEDTVSKIESEYKYKGRIKETVEQVKRCDAIGERTGWSKRYGGRQMARVVR